MKLRCPQAQILRIAQLEKFEFIINLKGVASIVSKDTSVVEGLLWKITTECEASLDLWEGVHENAYEKHWVSVC